MTKAHLKGAAALTVTLVVTAATLALSGALASASGGEAASSPVTGTRSGAIAGPSAEQVAAYPVLGTAATEADVVMTRGPGLEALQEAQLRYAANPELGRVAAETPAGIVAIVPGEGVLCLLVLQADGRAGSFCEPNATAATEGLAAQADVDNERYALLGVFPAAADASDLTLVSADGAHTPVALSGSAGYGIETSAQPSQLRWSGTAGAPLSRSLAWPPLPGSG